MTIPGQGASVPAATPLPVTPPPLAPPTRPGPMGRAPVQPIWPIVLGIIAIVLGAIGALYGAWNAVSTVFVGDIMSDLGPPETRAVFANMQAWSVPLMIVSAAGAVLGIVLGVGGGLLVSRSRRARPVLLGWAWLRIVHGLAQGMVVGLMQGDQMAAVMSQSGGPGAAVGASVGLGMAVMFAVLIALWAAALPVFMIVWLSRRRIVEQTRSWGFARQIEPTGTPAGT